MGISNWLAAVKEFNFKGKDFTGSKGPQRNAVLWGGGKKNKKKREEKKEDKEEEKVKRKKFSTNRQIK